MRFILLSNSESLCHHWRHFVVKASHLIPRLSCGVSPVSILVQNSPLDDLHSKDITPPMAIVAPGNSLFHMKGGYDRAISELVSSIEQIEKKLGSDYAPPGTIRKVSFENNEISDQAKELGFRFLIHIPTMRVPRPLNLSDLETKRYVFDLTWNVLNESADIGTLVLPGFGTGHGGLDECVVADAMISAILVKFCGLNDAEKAHLVLSYLQEDPVLLGKDHKPMDFDFLISSISPETHRS